MNSRLCLKVVRIVLHVQAIIATELAMGSYYCSLYGTVVNMCDSEFGNQIILHSSRFTTDVES